MVSAAEIVKNHRFVLLAKSWCPDVKYARSVFEKYGVLNRFHIIELDKLPSNEAATLESEFTALSGRKWVPSIFVDGAFWGNEKTLSDLESHDKTAAVFASLFK